MIKSIKDTSISHYLKPNECIIFLIKIHKIVVVASPPSHYVRYLDHEVEKLKDR